MYLSASAVA